MNLSILDAAADAPERLALIADGMQYTFGDLLPLVQAEMQTLQKEGVSPTRPYPVNARREVATLVRLYALFELGVPAALVHHRLTDAERQRLYLDAPAPAEGALVIIFTSGSSSKPKGVMLSREALCSSAQASATNLGWQENDRWLLNLPLGHIGGLSIVTRCLLARQCIVMAAEGRFSPQAVLDQLHRYRITIASLAPTMLAQILELQPPAAVPGDLRTLLLGGASASKALLSRAADLRWPVLTTYGLTEACSQVTTQSYGTVNRGQLGAGAALPGMQVRIVDGMVEIKGESLFSAYYPPQDAPWTADGWFCTGDFGRLSEDGILHLLSRRSDLIVTGGENVYPAEVEEALEAVPGVEAACVVGVPDPVWGQLVAAMVVRQDATTEAQINAHLREHLAPYKRPRVLLNVPALPLTGLGKVDRQEVIARTSAWLASRG